jgi:transcriptional regulator with XRE-family HTH domain
VRTISSLVNKLREAFKNEEYRHAYLDEYLNLSIATQIKVLREQRNWGQKELADKVGMKQPRISVMENVNYSSWSINTLRKLARAFNLTLRVSFESFGSRIKEIEQFNRKALERPSFDEDPVFTERREGATIGLVTAMAEANKNLMQNLNELPNMNLSHKGDEEEREERRKKSVLAVCQTNPYYQSNQQWRQINESFISKAGPVNLAGLPRRSQPSWS